MQLSKLPLIGCVGHSHPVITQVTLWRFKVCLADFFVWLSECMFVSCHFFHSPRGCHTFSFLSLHTWDDSSSEREEEEEEEEKSARSCTLTFHRASVVEEYFLSICSCSCGVWIRMKISVLASFSYFFVSLVPHDACCAERRRRRRRSWLSFPLLIMRESNFILSIITREECVDGWVVSFSFFRFFFCVKHPRCHISTYKHWRSERASHRGK